MIVLEEGKIKEMNILSACYLLRSNQLKIMSNHSANDLALNVLVNLKTWCSSSLLIHNREPQMSVVNNNYFIVL
jgi:hypothetical protein